MKSLAQLKIRDVDTKINQMSTEELELKIDLFYSLGYVYNPYDQEFCNPFINKTIKAIAVYKLDLERIENLHKKLEKEYLDVNHSEKTLNEISNLIYGDDKFSMIGAFLEDISGILGVVILFFSVLINVFGSLELATSGLIISFILINYYLIQNILFGINEDEDLLSIFWRKYHTYFLLFSILIDLYLCYLLYKVLNSYWLPFLIVISIGIVLRVLVKNRLSKLFWKRTGMNDIKEYAEGNSLL